MARIRKIDKQPNKASKNFFLVDACFLANKYLQIGTAPNPTEQTQIRAAHKWWKEIDRQLNDGCARVYVPDLCIAEAFKVLAKKYYQGGLDGVRYQRARSGLSADVSITHKSLQAQKRFIKFHDIPASRDIIVATGRFYELFMKHKCNVGVIDLILVSTAKFLMDFHDAKRSQLHIITHDNALWRGTQKVSELPNAYDPTHASDEFEKIFR
jgi:hypothetical protein